jgi:hypothetical protein
MHGFEFGGVGREAGGLGSHLQARELALSGERSVQREEKAAALLTCWTDTLGSV